MQERPQAQKVICYVVRDSRLLVFRHLDEPWDESGLQVPAGSIRAGESPADAALREAAEETGLRTLRLVRKLGETSYDMTPYRDEVQHRHVFHLEVDEETPEALDQPGGRSRRRLRPQALPVLLAAAGPGAQPVGRSGSVAGSALTRGGTAVVAPRCAGAKPTGSVDTAVKVRRVGRTSGSEAGHSPGTGEPGMVETNRSRRLDKEPLMNRSTIIRRGVATGIAGAGLAVGALGVASAADGGAQSDELDAHRELRHRHWLAGSR